MKPIIHDVEQGSPEWAQLRVGRVTASELGEIMTPKFAIKDGETPFTYLAKKVGEMIRGSVSGEDKDYFSRDMENGQIFEPDARRSFSFMTDLDVRQVGFVEHENGLFGCSPDGLIGVDSGLELKCPKATTHTKYLLRGEVPSDYITQVHGCMYATGATSWYFMSYYRGFAPFILKVERDEAIISKIETAVFEFNVKLQAAYQKVNVL